MGPLHIDLGRSKRSKIVAKAPTSVQVFGRKKEATAVAHCKRGRGMIRVNGRPLDLVEPVTLRMKVQEPILLLGKERLLALISVSVSVVVVKQLNYTPSDKPSQKQLLPITKSLLMKLPKKKSKVC